jgi:unspecific monooxygenase
MALLVPAVLILLCYAYFVLHRLVSLRKVPAAHWSSRFTSARILWARWTNSELNLLIDAHRRLGPIVLVGPKELSVSSYQDGIRKVYDAGFSKPAAFYSMLNYYGYRIRHWRPTSGDYTDTIPLIL